LRHRRTGFQTLGAEWRRGRLALGVPSTPHCGTVGLVISKGVGFYLDHDVNILTPLIVYDGVSDVR